MWHCVVVLDIFIWPWWPPRRAFSCIYLLLLTGALTLIDANWRNDPESWSWFKKKTTSDLDTEKKSARGENNCPEQTMLAANSRPRPQIWACPDVQLALPGRGARSIVIGW